MTTALSDVLAERARQDAKWGEQNHDPITYLAVLTEEVGELAQAALHTRFGGHAADGLRTEAVHVAAVALAMIECLDRGLWAWPGATPPESDPPISRDDLPSWLLSLPQQADQPQLRAAAERALALEHERPHDWIRSVAREGKP